MSVLLVLVPVSLSLAALFVAACLLSIKTGQFDDLESPRWRLLFDSREAGKPMRAAVPPDAVAVPAGIAGTAVAGNASPSPKTSSPEPLP